VPTAYLTRLPFYIEEAICISPDIKAIVSYGGNAFSSINSDADPLPPQLIHAGGPKTTRRYSTPLLPDPTDPESQRPVSGPVKMHRYPHVKRDTAWMLPADEEYHAQSAALAHTRTLTFLKPLLGGPWFDLEAVWDEHCRYEFAERDVAKTMATMVAQPYVNHIPTMTGGIGKERLTAFYAHHFIFANPADTELDLVSRTIGTDRIIDEFVFKLTHDRQVDWLLPGVPPTGKYLQIPFVSVVGVRGDRLCHEHIHWDQGTALRQAGLLAEWVKFPFPIEGEDGKEFEVRLPVGGVETAGKLVNEGSVDSNALMGKGWRVCGEK
jgi:carboxymethylenebutenolidase